MLSMRIKHVRVVCTVVIKYVDNGHFSNQFVCIFVQRYLVYDDCIC